jgi:hypothetical protein
MPAGGTCGTKPCWSESRNGVAYRDRGTGDGSLKFQFKGGNKPVFSLGASGARLAMPALPPAADPAVVVQLQRSDAATCVGSRFRPPANPKAGTFKATSE